MTLLYIKFVQSILRMLNNYIQKIEGELIYAFELIDILSNLIHMSILLIVKWRVL